MSHTLSPSSPQRPQRTAARLPVLAALSAAVLMMAGAAHAQGRIAVQAITQVAPNLPQYTMVDQPMLRDGMARATSNAAWSMSLLRSAGMAALANSSGLRAQMAAGGMGYRGDTPEICREART